jgi:hypothetical protein
VTTVDLLAPATKLPAPGESLELLQGLGRLQAAGPLVVTLYLRLDGEARVGNRYPPRRARCHPACSGGSGSIGPYPH